MRVKTSKYNPAAIGGQQGPANISFTGPLILHADPLNPKHAATKQYVDGRFGDLNAGDLKEGLLSVPLLPSFTGDAGNSVGSNIFTLAPSGVTLGTYTKVTVDNKGRVTNGGSLENEDIPDVTWSKVVKNKPTTLNGYGIQGALPATGGLVGPTTELRGVPTDPLHAVNREFVDSEVEALGSTASPGTVFRFSSDKTPEGFLRCSGGELDKVNYPALYSAIGDKFVPTNLFIDGGQYWRLQGNIGPVERIKGNWRLDQPLPLITAFNQIVVTGKMIHLIGGLNGGSVNINTIYSSSILEDDTLGPWSQTGTIPEPIAYSDAIVFNNRVYLFKEYVYTCSIAGDGSLGSWSTENKIPVPVGIEAPRPLLIGNSIYLLYNNNTTLKATIYQNGTIGNFFNYTTIPCNNMSSVVIAGDSVYIFGTGYTTTAYRLKIMEDGNLERMADVGGIPHAAHSRNVYVTRGRVHVIGGHIGEIGSIANNYSAPFSQDGNIGTWVEDAGLVVRKDSSTVAIVGNRVYLLGGVNYIYPLQYPRTNTVQSCNLSGGTNDYSQYYNGQHWVLNNPTKFKLPDHTHLEDQNTYYYIKY